VFRDEFERHRRRSVSVDTTAELQELLYAMVLAECV
jgi:hypothetical protein